MYKYLFLLFSLSYSILVSSQDDIELMIQVLEPYPIEIEHYLDNPDQILLNVTNTTASDKEIFYHVRLMADNGIDAFTVPSYRPVSPVNIDANQTIFYNQTELERDFTFRYPDDVDLSSVTPEQEDYITTYRALPEGNYQLCIRALDWTSGDVLGESCSNEFTVIKADAPQIMIPIDEDEIPATDNHHVFIQWSAPFGSSLPPNDLSYSIKIIDITDYLEADLQLLMDDPGVFPVLDRDAISDLFYNYDVPPENEELIVGHTYAIRVRAEDPDNNYPMANNGYSEIIRFRYGIEELEDSEIPDQINDCYLNCSFTDDIDDTPAGSTSAFSSIQVGQFEVDNISWTTDLGASASGTGEITLPFLDDMKIKVSFSGIGVNTIGRVYSGEITAEEDFSYDINQMDYTKAEEFNNVLRNGRVSGINPPGGAMGLPVGFIRNIAGANFMFGFTQMKFKADRASCQILQNLHIPQFGPEGWMTFAASDACLIPAGLAGEYYLHPVRDYTLDIQGSSMVFSGTTDTTQGSFFQMDCNGLKAVQIKGDYLFSENTLVKEDDEAKIVPGQVKASFTMRYDETTPIDQNIYAIYGEEGLPEEAGLQFIAALEIDPFQFRGLKAWGFEVKQAWIDYSDLSNPPNMQWPENYETDDNTWTGVYIKRADFKTPPAFLNDDRRERVEVQNIIIDPMLSGTFSIRDLLGINDGAIDDWAFSIDQLDITITQNNLESGGFSGQIGTPLTKEGQYFDYSAIIQIEDNQDNTSLGVEYTFSINPSDEFEFPFAISKVALNENSYIMGNLDPGDDQDTYFEAHFEGALGVNSELFNFDNNSGPDIPLKLPTMDFSMTYNSKDGFPQHDLPVFGFGDWESANGDSNSDVSTASFDPGWGPQFSEHSFGGFPLNIESIDLVPLSFESIKFNIQPHVSIALDQNGIGGSVDINIHSNLQSVANEKKFKLTSMDFSAISVNTNVYGIQLEGEIEFYNDQNSKGARGDLLVAWPMGFGATLAADFGMQVNDPTASLGTAQNYNYWFLDGMLNLPAGIALGTSGIGLYGFGGGLYVNMTNGNFDAYNQGETDAVMEQVKNLSTANQGVEHTGDNPVPAFQSYGLKLATTLGTMPSPLLMNMDVSIYGEFSATQGLNMLNIGGDVYHMCSITQREKSSLWSSATFGWEKINDGYHIFSGGMELFLDMPPLTGRKSDKRVVGVDFFAESGGDNRWWFHAGDPREDNYGEVNFEFPNLPTPSAKASAYFMAGHNLPDDLPIPDEVAWLMDNPSEGDTKNGLDGGTDAQEQERSSFDQLLAQSASGLAFGAQLNVSAEMNALIVYATLNAFLGFDINITHSDSRTCYITDAGDIAPGINGWYARGQAYAGLEGDVGLRFRLFKKDHDLKIFYLGAALMLSAGGPNPEWIEGRAGVRYSVLNGAFSGSTTFDVTIGQKCVPDYTDPFGGIDIIYETFPTDGDEDVSIFLDPSISFVLPVNERFTLPILEQDGSTTNQSFELSLHQVKVTAEDGSWSNTLTEDNYNWDENHTQVTVNIDQVLDEFTDYELEIEVRAFEIINGIKVAVKDEDNKTWKEKKTIAFTTGEAPYPIPDQEITRTFPIRNQRYFLQNEPSFKVAQILFNGNMKSTDPYKGYFPESHDNYQYEYFMRFQDLKGGEPIIKAFEPGNTVTIISKAYTSSEFQNDEIYSCQLVRKTTLIREGIGIGNLPFNRRKILESHLMIDEENQMEQSWEVSTETEAIDPGKTTAPNEALIYQFYFKTSKYNTLAEKMEHMSLSATDSGQGANNFPIVTIKGSEGFDVFDILGEVDAFGNTVVDRRIKLLTEENPDRLHSNYSFQGNLIGYQIQSLHPKGSNDFWQFAGAMYDTYMDSGSPVWEDQHPGVTYSIEINTNSFIPQALGQDDGNNQTLIDNTRTQQITIYPNPHGPDIDALNIRYEDLPLSLEFLDISGFDGPLTDQDISASSTSITQKFNYSLHTNSPEINSKYSNFQTVSNGSKPNNKYASTSLIGKEPIKDGSRSENISFNEPVLTIDYDLHTKARLDGRALFNHGYDIYYNFYDDDLHNQAWQNYLDEQYPDFLEVINLLDDNLVTYWYARYRSKHKLLEKKK